MKNLFIAAMAAFISQVVMAAEPTQQECVAKENHFFVKSVESTLFGKTEATACMAAYVSSDYDKNRSTLIFLSGDAEGMTPEICNACQMTADGVALIDKVNMVYLARPGMKGSSGGSHMDVRRTQKEMDFVSQAIDQIKVKYGIEAINLVGQSGGGTVVANMVWMRDDVKLAVFSSANVSVTEHRNLFRAKYRSDYIDPIDHVKKIKPDPTRKLVAFYDEKDLIVPPVVLFSYVAEMKQHGHTVEVIKAESLNSSHHALQGVAITHAAKILNKEVK